MKRSFSFTCFLHLLLALGITHPTKAQLTIVKDNIACAYGLKNSQGQWVVPAGYTLLEKLPNGCFRSVDGNGQGIVDAAGQVLVPGAYSQITVTIYGHYQVYRDRKTGLLNSRGKIIFPAEYDLYKPDTRGRFMLHRINNAGYTSLYADTAGAILIPETQGFILPFLERAAALIGDRPARQDNGVMGNAGLINTDGTLALPRLYDGLAHCTQHLMVIKNNLTGIMQLNGTWILEPKYYIQASYGYGIPCLSGDHIWPITATDGKKGLLKGDGTLLVPAINDDITPIMPAWQTPQATYFFHKNNKMGILASNGYTTLDALYDTLEVQAWMDQSTYQPKKIFFFCRQNGSYGLLQANGNMIVNPGYDAWHQSRLTEKPYYLFTRGLNVFVIDLAADNIVPQPATPIYHADTLHIYRFNNELFPMFSSRSRPGHLVASGAALQDYYSVGRLVFIKLMDRALIFTRDGKIWGSNNIQHIDPYNGMYALLYCNGRQGLVNTQTGKLVIDTIYQAINQSLAGRNIIWAQIDPLRDAVNGHRWMVLDTNGKKKTHILFDAVAYNGGELTVMRSGSLVGIIDADFNWLIPPHYKGIERIYKSYFSVFTKGNHVGIIDMQNKVIIDTIYTDLQPVFSTIHSNWQQFPQLAAANPAWWLLQNSQQGLLFNSNGLKIQSASPAFQQLLDSFVLKGAYNASQAPFRIFTTPAQDTVLANVPYRQQLVRTTRAVHEAAKNQQLYYRFRLLAAGPLYYTMELSRDSMPPRSKFGFGMPEQSHRIRNFNSYYWQNGSLTSVQLSDIFGNGPLLQNLLVNAIKARDDLNLDCSNPATLTQQVGQRFSLSSKGVILYLPGKNMYQEFIELLVPLAELEKHPESNWLVAWLRSP